MLDPTLEQPVVSEEGSTPRVRISHLFLTPSSVAAAPRGLFECPGAAPGHP